MLRGLRKRETKSDKLLRIEHGKPMIFGATDNKGIYLDGTTPRVVEIGKDYSIDDILVHNEKDEFIADMLSNFASNDVFPEPIGVLYCKERATYDSLMERQIEEAKKNKSKKTLNDLLNAGDTWEVK